jgi:hypothetical protein
MTDKHHHKAHHAEHEEDIAEIEDSLFSDTGEEEPEVGLIKKSHAHSHASHAHHGGTHRKELRLSIPVPDRDMMIKAGIGLIALLLLISFFYNPFYCSFPWNKSQCSIADTEDEEDDVGDVEVADDVDVTVGDEDEEEAESDVEELVEDVEPESSSGEEESDVVEGDADVDGDVVDLSGDITFDFTKLPDISVKEWGWEVEKIYFSVDNQKENFIPKVRVKVYEGSEKGTNLRADTVKVYPELAVGKKLISSIDFIAMIGSKGADALIIMELKDEGEETGLAEDTLLKKITKTVNHPVS